MSKPSQVHTQKSARLGPYEVAPVSDIAGQIQLGAMFTILSICKGGGYRYARTDPPHPKRNANGLYPLHRVLMENKLGRLLAPGEVVHHSDGNDENDAPENLVLMTNAEHSHHHARPARMMELTCSHCKKQFLRVRRAAVAAARAGHKPYCSHGCSLKARHAEPIVQGCALCGKEIALLPGTLRSRLNNCSSVREICCSKSCARQYGALHIRGKLQTPSGAVRSSSTPS